MKFYEDKSFPGTSMLQILLKSLISQIIIIIIIIITLLFQPLFWCGKMAIHFLIIKLLLVWSPVSKANGHILKSQTVESFTISSP